MTTNQNRVQAGVPAGGEFSTSARGEPDVTLVVAAPTHDQAAFACEVADVIDAKGNVADRAWRAAPGGDSTYLYGREYVVARHLAILSDPALVEDSSALEKVAGQMLRRSRAELAENAPDLFPRPLTGDERERAVRKLAEYAVANDSVLRKGQALAPDATLGTRDGALEALCEIATPSGGTARENLQAHLQGVDLSDHGAIDRIAEVTRIWAQ